MQTDTSQTLPPTVGQPSTEDSFSHDTGLNKLIRDDSDEGRRLKRGRQARWCSAGGGGEKGGMVQANNRPGYLAGHPRLCVAGFSGPGISLTNRCRPSVLELTALMASYANCLP